MRDNSTVCQSLRLIEIDEKPYLRGPDLAQFLGISDGELERLLSRAIYDVASSRRVEWEMPEGVRLIRVYSIKLVLRFAEKSNKDIRFRLAEEVDLAQRKKQDKINRTMRSAEETFNVGLAELGLIADMLDVQNDQTSDVPPETPKAMAVMLRQARGKLRTSFNKLRETPLRHS